MATNKEECVSFEVAKLLKKKEFDKESKVNLEFEKYIEEQKQKVRNLIRF